MKTEITFLGTASAIPTKTKNHTAILLKYDDENILIDCGEGTQRQFRKAGMNPCKITRILLTHLHGDHIFGLPGLFQTLALNNYQKTLLIYGPKGTKKMINEMFKILLVKQKIKVEIYEVSGKFIDNEKFSISCNDLEHDTPTLGYRFVEKDRLRIKKDKLEKLKLKNNPEIGKLSKGKNIKVNGKTLKYKDMTYLVKGKVISIVLDTKKCANIKKLVKDSDLAIMESTFLDSKDSKYANEYFHMTAVEASEIAKSSKVKKLILTHLSQRYEYKEKVFEKVPKKIFKDTTIAKDFMKVIV